MSDDTKATPSFAAEPVTSPDSIIAGSVKAHDDGAITSSWAAAAAANLALSLADNIATMLARYPGDDMILTAESASEVLAALRAVEAVRAIVENPENYVMQCQECAIGPSLVAALALSECSAYRAGVDDVQALFGGRAMSDDTTGHEKAAMEAGRAYEPPASEAEEPRYTLSRLPKHLQTTFIKQRPRLLRPNPLRLNEIHQGDARLLLSRIQTDSVALSVWSPPYFVGKSYESELTFTDWQNLLRDTIAAHFAIIKPGGFLVVNIADILCFKDPKMPKVQAEAITRRRSTVTREDVERAMQQRPSLNRYQIAALLGCSEQTVDRRLNGNNIRGGKYDTQTRIKIVGGLLEEWALAAGLYPYDRRVWVKDAAWENSRWASLSYRAVDEFEHLFFFWKPGVTTVNRERLTPEEWKQWGARGVWDFPSVRSNDDHEAKFPIELPLRTIRLLTDAGDTVLDCFMGSGTTAVAAIKTNRNFIGIELERKSVELARQNVARSRREQNADRAYREGVEAVQALLEGER